MHTTHSHLLKLRKAAALCAALSYALATMSEYRMSKRVNS